MVVVLSPAVEQSQYVHMEYHYAQEEDKHVIPVLWQAVKIPMDLRLTQCINFQSDYDDGLRQLVQALSFPCRLPRHHQPRPCHSHLLHYSQQRPGKRSQPGATRRNQPWAQRLSRIEATTALYKQ